MTVTTYEGVVENGRIQLPAGVLLPEKTKVFVIVPGMQSKTAICLRSPRLVAPSQASQCDMETTEEQDEVT